MECLEDRLLLSAPPLLEIEPNNTPAAANAIPLAGQVIGTAGAGDVDWFRLSVTQAGQLSARLHATGFAGRLSLFSTGPAGTNLLVQSDGASSTDADGLITLHLQGDSTGTPYLLRVEGLDTRTGSYTLTTDFTTATRPLQPADVGYLPAGVATADFNGDGIPDLAVANLLSNTISVLVGLGDGTFHSTGDYTLGSNERGPISLVAGDFTGDGHTDLAVADSVSGAVSLLAGNGDGTFRAAGDFTVGNTPYALAAADFGGHGHLDLAVADAGSGDVTLLLNDGNGNFHNGGHFAVGSLPVGVVAADLNGDGHPDLITADSGSNDLSILLNNGSGGFGPAIQVAVGNKPTSLTVADLNGDGHADVVVTNADSGDVSVLLGDGTGSFRPVHRYAVGSQPFDVVAADLNGDGKLDLAVNNNASNDVTVLVGDGQGNFTEAGRYAAGNGPNLMTTADFNRGGRVDLAITNSVAGDVVVLFGLGNGTFQAAPQVVRGIVPPVTLATADFNGDGKTDLATADFASNDLTVLLGQGSGGFVKAAQVTVGDGPVSLASGDFNGDGKTDLVVALYNANAVQVLLGNGDGTFQAPLTLAAGSLPASVAVGDFDGDGKLDFAVADGGSSDVIVYLGDGHGAFRLGGRFLAQNGLASLVAADFNGDGKTDLAVASDLAGDVSVLLNTGGGSFGPAQHFTVGNGPVALTTADFNGDGHADLAAAEVGSDAVAVLLGKGDGTFAPMQSFAVHGGPYAIVAGDFNGDGKTDLATADPLLNDVALLAGNGDGTFQAAVYFATAGGSQPFAGGASPQTLVAADLDGDGHLDLVAGNARTRDVTVLLGGGDGTFWRQPALPVGSQRFPVLAADLNRDGRPDQVTADNSSGELLVALGQGDGTFQTPARYHVGPLLSAIVSADLNGDSRPDLIVAYRDGIAILLGLGDGTFRAAPVISMAERPQAVVAGDFNGDGKLDLAVATAGDVVQIFLGDGAGGFTTGGRFAVGEGGPHDPVAVVAADFDGDGKLDLATANSESNTLSVLRGNGDGTFAAAVEIAVGLAPSALVADDLNHDGKADLAVANRNGDGSTNDGSVSVLLNRGDGTFRPAVSYAVGSAPVALAVGQLNDDNGDGILDRRDLPDLVAADSTFGDVSILLSDPATPGTFRPAFSETVGGSPASLALADLDGNGTTDVLVADAQTGGVTVRLEHLLHGGTPPFYFTGPGAAAGVEPTPVLADLNGDGTPDSVVVSRAGQILLRLGEPGQPGQFSPPLVVNPLSAPAQAVAVVRAGPQTLLAALGQIDDQVYLYSFDGAGRPTLRGTLALETNSLPTRIVAGDLAGDHDGFDDLAVLNALSGRVTVFLSDGRGGFGPPATTDLGGNGPSDLSLADVSGDGIADLVVTNRVSGDVTVLTNNGNGSFFAVSRFRAGPGPDDVAADGSAVVSFDRPGGAAAGDFNGDGAPDLIVPDPGSNSLALLFGEKGGNFLNPVIVPLGFSPAAVATGDFNHDGHDDLAVLDRANGVLHVFLGDGHGGLQEKVTHDGSGNIVPLLAGDLPGGITVADVNADGIPDLQIGNDHGDVLTLLGNGDGTFQPYQRADRGVSLAVVGGRFVLSNRAQDQLTEQQGLGGTSSVFQDRTAGIRAPGQVQVVTVAGSSYLVVANGGGNDVLVYQAAPGGGFMTTPAQTLFVGTDPVGVTVADVNGDGVPDVVVANQGSNDVSVLLGRTDSSGWSLAPGPRLQAGGVGPVSTAVADANGDGIPDILVSDKQSNNVALLPGVGNGFFNDQSPTLFNTGIAPVQALVGNFDGIPGLDLLTVNSGSNSLTLFSGFGAGRDIGSGGDRPVAALAGDFTGDGLTDLVVANNGDGAMALFLGSPDGPSRLLSAFSPDLLNPSALALAGLGPDGLALYAADEGRDSVALISFSLESGVPVPLGPATPGLGEQRPVIAQLGPLDASTIDVVVSFVVAGPQELVEERAVVSLSSQLFTLLVGLSNTAGDANDDTELRDETQPTVTQTGRPLRIDLPGLDAASERIREEARQRLGIMQDGGIPDEEGPPPEDEPEAWLFDVARSLALAWQARDRTTVREMEHAEPKPADGPAVAASEPADHADARPKEATADVGTEE